MRRIGAITTDLVARRMMFRSPDEERKLTYVDDIAKIENPSRDGTKPPPA